MNTQPMPSYPNQSKDRPNNAGGPDNVKQGQPDRQGLRTNDPDKQPTTATQEPDQKKNPMNASVKLTEKSSH